MMLNVFLIAKRLTDNATMLWTISFVLNCYVCCLHEHSCCCFCRGAVEILLRENANVNVVDSRGCNPLHLAAWKGNLDICKTLLTNPHSQIQVNLQVRKLTWCKHGSWTCIGYLWWPTLYLYFIAFCPLYVR